MSDAWNTPGWTAQESAYYYTDDSAITSWKLPSDVDMVTVNGSFSDVDGGLAFGYVSIEATSALQHVASKRVLMPPKFFSRIRRDGSVSFDIPATDTAALSPLKGSFTYKVTIVLGRKLFKEFYCTLAAATPVVDLFDITPTTVEGDGLVVGVAPEHLTVVLTEGSSFNWTIQSSEDWALAPVLVFEMGDGSTVSWTTTINGPSASFAVPAADVSSVIALHPIQTTLYVGESIYAQGGPPVVVT